MQKENCPSPAFESIDSRAATLVEMTKAEGGGHAKENSTWCWNSYLCFGYSDCENPYDIFDKP